MPRSLAFLQKMAEGRKDSPRDNQIIDSGEGEKLHRRKRSSDFQVPGEQSPTPDLGSIRCQSVSSQSSLQGINQQQQEKSSSSIAEEGRSSKKKKRADATPNGANTTPGYSNIDYWRKALWFERSEKKKLQEQAMVDKKRAVEYVKKLKFQHKAALEKSKGLRDKQNATLRKEAHLFKERYKHAVSESKSLSLDLYESVLKNSSLEEQCEQKQVEVQKLKEQIEHLAKQMEQDTSEPGNTSWHNGQLLKPKEINIASNGSMGETMPDEVQSATEISSAHFFGDGEDKARDISGFEDQDDDPDDNAILRAKIKVLKHTSKRLKKEISDLKTAQRRKRENKDMGSRWKLEVQPVCVQSFWGAELISQMEKDDIVNTYKTELLAETRASFNVDHAACETNIPENRRPPSELSMHITNQFVRAEDMLQTVDSRSELHIELTLDLAVCTENNLEYLPKVFFSKDPMEQVTDVVEDENIAVTIDEDRGFVYRIVSYLLATITCYVTTLIVGLLVRLLGPRRLAILSDWWTFGWSTYTYGRGVFLDAKHKFLKGLW